MDDTIYVIFKVQFDFVLEVWFSIRCKATIARTIFSVQDIWWWASVLL